MRVRRRCRMRTASRIGLGRTASRLGHGTSRVEDGVRSEGCRRCGGLLEESRRVLMILEGFSKDSERIMRGFGKASEGIWKDYDDSGRF